MRFNFFPNRMEKYFDQLRTDFQLISSFEDRKNKNESRKLVLSNAFLIDPSTRILD